MIFNEYPYQNLQDINLDWILKKYKTYDDTITALDKWIEINTPKIEDLETFKNALESGNLPEGVAQAIRDWCAANLIDLMSESIKNVFFGLTTDGYFVAYIPESWSDITFNTSDYDITLTSHPEIGYGHLILSY
jgi:hypothetical protein